MIRENEHVRIKPNAFDLISGKTITTNETFKVVEATKILTIVTNGYATFIFKLDDIIRVF